MATDAARKRLVICVDGTYCTPDGTNPKPASHGTLTNVYNMFACVKQGEVVDSDGITWFQDRWYSQGLGAIERAGSLAKLNAGAWGTGYRDLIREVYEKCCDLDETGEVWLYGFSRGAYIVRAVAGLLHYIRKLKSVGTPAFNRDYKEALAAYKSLRGRGQLGRGQINLTFTAKTVPAPTIKFIGLFDTVKAVQDEDVYDIAPNSSIQNIRHALALHEDRNRFTPEYMSPKDADLRDMHDSSCSLVQAWFAGAHLDIGGSADEAGLALYPLQWMMIESRKYGLVLKFHGNAPHMPEIDDPLQLVFPPDPSLGKRGDLWSCTVENGLVVEMQDIRSVHTLSKYEGRYKVKINRDKNPIWIRRPRRPFSAPDKKQKTEEDIESICSTLKGYSAVVPMGTIIHPSVYCLIDSNINIIMDSKQGVLVQHLSEWSSRMLGQIELTFHGTTKLVPNPGFWNGEDDDDDMAEELPPLRILICGPTGVGKSTLVSKVFGVDFGMVSARTRGIHKVTEEVTIPGRNDFILHDSKGFEGGSTEELEEVRQFVRERVEEYDLRKQLHVIWFCVEAGSTRVLQKATESLFTLMGQCQRHVPVVVVATKKDSFVNMRVGGLIQQGNRSLAECQKIAQEELHAEASFIEGQILDIPGASVQATVCVDQNDKKSIDQLTAVSSTVFQDEKTRLMYVKAQMALPDLKIDMAVYEVMRCYKRAVGSAAGTAWIPFGPTGSRQGSKDDICRRIITCFGTQDLDTRKALQILQSKIRDGAAEGLTMFWCELLACAGVSAFVFGFTAPAGIATGLIGAYLITPLTAQLYLCTAADLILILAKSFQVSSQHDRAQPRIEDVETAAEAFGKYAEDVHRRINKLVPRKNAFKSFQYGKIAARFEEIVDEFWNKMIRDSAHEAVTAMAERESRTVQASSLALSEASSSRRLSTTSSLTLAVSEVSSDKSADMPKKFSGLSVNSWFKKSSKNRR